jgi:hypothetical protein
MYQSGAGAQMYSKRQRSPRPGPGYYRPNDGAVASTNSFEDDLRMQPLKGMTAEKIKLRTLEQRIRNYNYAKNNLESLNVKQQREVNLVTAADVAGWIRQRDVLRGLAEDGDDKLETAKGVRRSLMGRSDRPATTPFANTEERFFDPRQNETTGRPGTLCRATRLGNLQPQMYEPHPIHSTFGYGRRQHAPTFPRQGRPLDEQHLLQFHEGLGPFVSSRDVHTIGPGQYDAPTDILCSSLGVADDQGNVKSHFMNKNTPSYRPATTASIKHASNMGLPVPKDKPRDNAHGQAHTRLAATGQHPSIGAAFGSDSKDALTLSRSFAEKTALGRFAVEPTEIDLGNTLGSAVSAPSLIGLQGRKQAKAQMDAKERVGKKFTATKSRADRVAAVAAAAAVGDHEDDYTRSTLGVAARTLVVGLPEKERVNAVSIDGTLNSIPNLGRTMKQVKGPKYLPGTM